MLLEIVTPDESVFEGEVESATFPGNEGSFQVLGDHAAMISTLGHGEIKLIKEVEKRMEEVRFTVSGGVVEVKNNRVVVLAETIINE